MLNIQWIDIDSLKLNPRNARTHSKKQIKQLSKSLSRLGWTAPINADENNVVLTGHARLAASRELGLKQVPVNIMRDLSEVQKRALAIADNKIASNAGWDRERLTFELAELAHQLPELSLTLDDIGFSAAEFDGLKADLSEDREPTNSTPNIASSAVSRSGDLWKLGEHRVYCGDFRQESVFQQLMGRQLAQMMFGDAPYNVKISDTVGRGRRKHREFAFGSGEMSSHEHVALMAETFGLCAKYSILGSLHFCPIDWRHLAEMNAAGSQAFTELKNVVVWVKNNAGQGSFYRSQHELIFVYKSGDAAHQNNIELGRHGRNRSNVWDYPRVDTFRTGPLAELTLHPTVKPIQLVADAILDCTRRGDIVLDPFLGSGTTVMAAEKVGRRGYGIEIDPLYVDATVRRWQEFTKRDAVLGSSGNTFDDLAAKRHLRRVRRIR